MSLRRVAQFLKSHLPASRTHAAEAPRHKAGGRRRFLINERGSVAIYFGLSAIVFVGVAGLAVDAARGYLVKARLSEAIDAAALAGGKALQNSSANNATINSDVLAFFNANFPNGAMGANVQTPNIAVINNEQVQVSSNATIPTTLMRVLGFSNMTMSASATVARAATGLDVVFSFDNSGSMNDTISGSSTTKIQQQRSNAQTLVDTLAQPFTSGAQQQIVTVNGTNYSLLNIGVVPWNSKVNVHTYVPGSGTMTGTGTVTTGASYSTDPMGRYSGTQHVYKSSTSEVPLLYDPRSMPGGSWSGCVFARYNGDTNYGNDADLTLGSATVGGTYWPGWEPMSNDETEPQQTYFGNFAFGQTCDEGYWNENRNSADGSARPTNWYNLPSSQQHNEDCSSCPSVGILPLTSNTTDVKNMINTLTAGGNTNAAQGLFWAWEVLMPGDPFNEAVVNPPFERAQAIVLMTDGQSHGGNGDAYHGWFGAGDQSSSVVGLGKMNMPAYDGSCNLTTTQVDNNLGNRLLALATQIKGCDTTSGGAGQGPVKIYVIQYQQTGEANLTTLLSSVATKPTAPYFFQASNETDLENAFTQIGASLSALRLVQ